jgi:uncharacterized damage-inducible protein DinB
MSVFTNSASSAKEQRDQYISAVLGLLGDADPHVVLASTPTWCERETAGLTAAQLRRPETDGKWSLVEILQHLADSELVWGYRLRKVLAEDRPELTGYDQDLWATRLRYTESAPEQSLSTFRVLRDANMRLLAGASDAALDRVGLHNERGPETVRHMVRLYAGHDLLHRNQISRVRLAVTS